MKKLYLFVCLLQFSSCHSAAHEKTNPVYVEIMAGKEDAAVAALLAAKSSKKEFQKLMNFKDSQGWSVLSRAVEKDMLSVVEEIIEPPARGSAGFVVKKSMIEDAAHYAGTLAASAPKRKIDKQTFPQYAKTSYELGVKIQKGRMKKGKRVRL